MTFTVKDVLRLEVAPALGCTEPVAVALADGLARALEGGEAAAIVPLRHSYRFLIRDAALADALADPGLAAEMGRAMALVRLACGEAA